MTATDDAFRWARIYAVRHMTACEQAGLRWGETSITEIVTAQASWAVTVVPFTQQAEARSGADWVWWWADDAGAYGMLVQAKRMTVAQSKWNFGFGYKMKGATRTQREVLLSAATSLGLLRSMRSTLEQVTIGAGSAARKATGAGAAFSASSVRSP